MGADSKRLGSFRNVRFVIVLALIIAFLVTSTYAVMGDSSVRGLATKLFSVDRHCTTNTATLAKNVAFYVVASVWSASSLHTSITSVKFSLSVDGTNLGTLTAPDRSWDPGNGVSYTLTFPDPLASPQSLPTASNLVLSVTARVSAGLNSAQITASDKNLQDFGNKSC